jgi:sugar phosphate isomerase/epimerase
MKLACMTLLYSKYPIERALEGIARAGFRYVGFGWPHEGKDVPDETDEGVVPELRRLFAEYKLEPVLLSGFRQFSPGQPLERARRCMQTAKELGIKEVLSAGTWTYRMFPDEPVPEAEAERLHREYVEHYKQVAAIAEEMDIIVTIKPHSGNTATAGHIVQTLGQIGSPNIRANYDPGNVHYYEGIRAEDDFRPIAGQAYSIVAKDHRGAKANLDFPIPGTGDVNFPAIFGMQHASGFDGTVLVERVDGPADAESIDQRLAETRSRLQLLLENAGFIVEG